MSSTGNLKKDTMTSESTTDVEMQTSADDKQVDETDTPLFGFEMSLDEMIEMMKVNLPDIWQFDEIKELTAHFDRVKTKMENLAKQRKAAERQLNDLKQRVAEYLGESDVQPMEVLKISDDDEDIKIVEVKLPSNETSQVAPRQSLSQSEENNLNYLTTIKELRDTNIEFIGDTVVVKFKVGKKMRVVAMKQSGWWYKGTVTNIIDESLTVDQWKMKVNFDCKGGRTVTMKELALLKPMPNIVVVGSRVCAVYKPEYPEMSKVTQYYGGIVVEPPTIRNSHRFLVFFEDGYAQYCTQNEVFKVIAQNKIVSKDINPDSQEFIQDYLSRYPERPMVRLSIGQIIRTEYEGKWWTTRVTHCDCSLVKMLFLSDKRTEWIYRGSTRLAPLYDDLAKTESLKGSQPKNRPQKAPITNQKRKTIVEYVRNDSSDQSEVSENKRRSGPRRKSIADAPTDVQALANNFQYSSISGGRHIPSSTKTSTENISLTNKGRESMGQLMSSNQNEIFSKLAYYPHLKCGPLCLGKGDDKLKHKGENPLAIPMKCGWERHISQPLNASGPGKRHVYYRAPCGRRLRTMNEMITYLYDTNSNLTIDLFCFDSTLNTDTEFLPVKTFCDIKDLTYNVENVPLPCVNAVDVQMPDFIRYSTERKPTQGVFLNLDPNFLVCCECTDFCTDSSKCACIKLTMEAADAVGEPATGYTNRTLKQRILSGIYECNSQCGCDSRCFNRVVQNGLERRLQVYRTEKRGWGLRCLNDIPVGGFVCFYTGEILTSTAANEDGTVFGDEYLAEIDYIEVVEKKKEGYESDVESDSSEPSFKSDSINEDSWSDSDSNYSGGNKIGKKKAQALEKRTLPNRNKSKMTKNGADTNTNKSKPAKPSKGKTNVTNNNVPNTTPAAVINRQSSAEDDVIILDSDDETEPTPITKKTAKKTQSKDKISRFKNLPDPKQDSMGIASSEKSSNPPFISVRDLYNDGSDVYVIDAKAYGNLGRYLNHSCSPNTFVQNVFVDTQDPRFPWVAFFANKYIRAGSELTWDYNYQVDSVPGKVLYCYCGSSRCRGRLL